MGRKLATIRRINDIQPIEGADRIEVATVNGWKVVVAKNVGHEVGDLVVYCEIDSFLPVRDEFEFLRKTSYKKMGEQEGFRLKTIKMRGQVSQGLILPISVFEGFGYEVKTVEDDKTIGYTGNVLSLKRPIEGRVFFYSEYKIGDDVSNELGIVKYDPPLPAQLSGTAKGYFPSFIPKTDEERIQNLTEEYEEWKNSDKKFYASEKLDGSSATFYMKDGEFGVCSRNLELIEDDSNSFWKVAREMKIEEKLRTLDGNYALQGELIGTGIQKNPYKINGQRVEFFNVFDIDKQERVGHYEMFDILDELNLPMVPFNPNFTLPDTIDELLQDADDTSLLNEDTMREGLVIRSYDQTVSFKVISNEFLLNE